jgi:hypothetical protein
LGTEDMEAALSAMKDVLQEMGVSSGKPA